MSITLSIWSLVIVLTAAILIGFWIGRSISNEKKNPDDMDTKNHNNNEHQQRKEEKKTHGVHHKQDDMDWAIGSPAAGELSLYHEEGKKGVIIYPEHGTLYAPVEGKIVKLYPTGNAFRIRTDYGIELLIQAGVKTKELEGMHYRPRVVQNEIVVKGKLLLEFDLKAICTEGYDPSIRMSIEDGGACREIAITEAPHVKVGEDILWVSSR